MRPTHPVALASDAPQLHLDVLFEVFRPCAQPHGQPGQILRPLAPALAVLLELGLGLVGHGPGGGEQVLQLAGPLHDLARQFVGVVLQLEPVLDEQHRLQAPVQAQGGDHRAGGEAQADGRRSGPGRKQARPQNGQGGEGGQRPGLAQPLDRDVRHQRLEHPPAIAVDAAADIGVDREPLLDLAAEQDVEPVRLSVGLPEGEDVQRLVEILVDVRRDDRLGLWRGGEILALGNRTQDAVAAAQGRAAMARRPRRHGPVGTVFRARRRRIRRGLQPGVLAMTAVAMGVLSVVVIVVRHGASAVP